MRIGQFAERAGVNIQTIRFYEREQILRKPPRTPGGYRLYSDADLHHVEFVKVCQGLGFTLTEIKSLMSLHASLRCVQHGETKPLDEICALAADRLRMIDLKIESLQRMRQNLLDLLQRPSLCPSHKVLSS